MPRSQDEKNCEGAQTDLDGVLEAQKGEEILKGHRARNLRKTETRLSNGEDFIVETEEQVSWRVEKWWKS